MATRSLTDTEREDYFRELQSGLAGSVRHDLTYRLLYATDASLWEMLPLGVVTPKHAGDVVRTVRMASDRGIPLLPRGSGTSLAGQAVNTAVVLDFTPHMREILELNVEERWVRVQPGVILDELNAYLRPHNLMFAPDVATSNRASIGGMMGNNSCGARSILYGKTVDHVLEQEVVLADGSTTVFKELAADEWERRAGCNSHEGRIYNAVQRICRDNAEEIDRRFPRIMRRVGGYNLDEFVRNGSRNLAKLAVGSEGTLVTVTEAKLNLVPTPKHKALLVPQYSDLLAALEDVRDILKHHPATVELTDRVILDLTKDNPELSRARTFLAGDPEAILAVELTADSEAALLDKLSGLEATLKQTGRSYTQVALPDAARQADCWNVRKAGLGLLMGMKGDSKPVGFVEDTAVPQEHLADYIREFRALLGEYGLDACYYAHASVGCIHVRPVLNLKLADDRFRMREIAGRVADLVLRYGGAMSAEHGDGIARSEWQERMYGPQVYQAFREVKAAFDPQGIMNPGKIVDAPKMNELLRLGEDYKTIPIQTLLDFKRDGGFAGAVEMCAGVGACRKKTDGTMCPSYRATLDEEHSTRGRANILREALAGRLGTDTIADERVKEVLDLCLECKACKSECPSNVDMAKLKYEFLSHYQAKHGTPLRSRFFASAPTVAKLASPFAAVVNPLLQSGIVRDLLESALSIDRRRSLPPYAAQTFRAWWRTHQPDPRAGSRGEVMLFPDTFTNFHEPEIGQAAVRVLEACGYRVRIPEVRCCGRPMISKGLLREAKDHAAYNIAALDGEGRDLPIIGLEPSCVVALKDEYREFNLGEGGDAVAARTWMLEDFLAAHVDAGSAPFRSSDRPLHLHGHCHQKAVLGTKNAVAGLKLTGQPVTLIPSGCCGMAGTFGYEKEHYDLSVRVGELSLLPYVRALPEGSTVIAPGTSCRHQLRDCLNVRALHPAEALAFALVEEPL